MSFLYTGRKIPTSLYSFVRCQLHTGKACRDSDISSNLHRKILYKSTINSSNNEDANYPVDNFKSTHEHRYPQNKVQNYNLNTIR